MSEVTITLMHPPRELNPNTRVDRYAKARAVKAYRFACKVDAQNVRESSRVAYPLTAPVEAEATFFYDKGLTPDLDNLLASLKAGIDGLVDAQILKNDRDISSWKVYVQKGPRRVVAVRLTEVIPHD